MAKLLRTNRKAPVRRRGCRINRELAVKQDILLRSVNEKNRTVDAVITTPTTEVIVYDSERGEYVSEVLIPTGMEVQGERARLLKDHRRFSVDSILGSLSVRSVAPQQAIGRMHFSSASDVKDTWIKVKEGHARSVSVSGVYAKRDFKTLPVGESFEFEGVTYRGSKTHPTRFVKRWTLEEVSVVVFGADSNAVTRSKNSKKRTRKNSQQESERQSTADQSRNSRSSTGSSSGASSMKLRNVVRRFLRSAGMNANMTDIRALEFARTKLSLAQRKELLEIDPSLKAELRKKTERTRTESEPETKTRKTVRTEQQPKRVPKKTTQATARRGGTATLERPVKTSRSGKRTVSREQIRKQEQQREIKRQSEIRELAEGQNVPKKIIERAIKENWTPEQFGLRMYKRIQKLSGKPVGQTRRGSGSFGIHSSPDMSVQGLQAGLLLREGVDLESKAFRSPAGRQILERNNLGWLADFSRDMEVDGRSDHEQIVDIGRKVQDNHALRFCERMLDVTDRRGAPSNQDELIERSFSNAYMPNVFGAVVASGIAQGFEEGEDNTEGWTSSGDVADFRQIKTVGMEANGQLKKHVRGTVARDIEISEFGEAFQLDRYSGKFLMDDMDIIDDTLGIVDGQIPIEMGRMARELISDLIWSLILSNPTLSDGIALFHASHGNLKTSNAFSLTNLAGPEDALNKQTKQDAKGNKKALNLKGGYLLVPGLLLPTAKQAIGSTQVLSGSNGNLNPWNGNYKVKSDSRMSIGVQNPDTEAFITGSDSDWYMMERNGTKTVKKIFRRGTGRAPVVRSQRLPQIGAWGIGWDVNFDVGAGVVSYKGMVKSTA